MSTQVPNHLNSVSGNSKTPDIPDYSSDYSSKDDEDNDNDDHGHQPDGEHAKNRGVKFNGIIVSRNCSPLPTTKGGFGVESISDSSVRDSVQQIQRFMELRPIATIRAIQGNISSSRCNIEEALPFCGYMFASGPWKGAIIRFGTDPRSDSQYRFYQTLTFNMEFDPIVEPTKHTKTMSFPRFLRENDNRSHLFDGKKFSPVDNTWQICDIVDPLLREIISTCHVRSEISWKDGFFWNGTMAKVEIVMRDKLVCIRDGRLPDDQDYRCLLAFPDRYEAREDRDHIRYGLEFGEQYSRVQTFLRGKLVSRARESFHEY